MFQILSVKVVAGPWLGLSIQGTCEGSTGDQS